MLEARRGEAANGQPNLAAGCPARYAAACPAAGSVPGVYAGSCSSIGGTCWLRAGAGSLLAPGEDHDSVSAVVRAERDAERFAGVQHPATVCRSQAVRFGVRSLASAHAKRFACIETMAAAARPVLAGRRSGPSAIALTCFRTRETCSQYLPGPRSRYEQLAAQIRPGICGGIYL